jgi:hypothetical protein
MSQSLETNGNTRPVIIREVTQSQFDEFDDELDWNSENLDRTCDNGTANTSNSGNSSINASSIPMSLDEINDAFGFGGFASVSSKVKEVEKNSELEHDTTAPLTLQNKVTKTKRNSKKLAAKATLKAERALARLEEVDKIRARKLKRTVQAIAGKLQWQLQDESETGPEDPTEVCL